MTAACRLFPTFVLAVVASGLFASPGFAQETIALQISVQNHQFRPSEIHGRANVPIILRIKNQDGAAMEFEEEAERRRAGMARPAARLPPRRRAAA